MFETFEEASTYIEEQAITMIDLKFCDLWGRWHHLTLPAHAFAPSLIDRGTGIDGSSVGFKSVSAATDTSTNRSMTRVVCLSTAAR